MNVKKTKSSKKIVLKITMSMTSRDSGASWAIKMVEKGVKNKYADRWPEKFSKALNARR